MKRVLLALPLIFVMFFQACTGGPLSKLDSTLDYAPLFFQGLVATGKISQSSANKYKDGVVAFERIAGGTKKCLSDNVKPDASCYVQMGDETRLAIGEFYPTVANAEVNKYVSLVREIVELIIRKNVGGGPVGGVIDDSTIENKIDELNKLLKEKPVVETAMVRCLIIHSQEDCDKFDPPLDPCESLEDRELGRRFSNNCDVGE